MRRHCGHCHSCGSKMIMNSLGEEWCPLCQKNRRYKSHGFNKPEDKSKECPSSIDLDVSYFKRTGKLRMETT